MHSDLPGLEPSLSQNPAKYHFGGSWLMFEEVLLHFPVHHQSVVPFLSLSPVYPLPQVLVLNWPLPYVLILNDILPLVQVLPLVPTQNPVY